MTYFLVPLFNEESNIRGLAGDLNGLDYIKEKFFVFSDDGSTDNTIKTIKEHFTAGNCVVLGDGKNYGPGHAFAAGFEWILSYSASDEDIIVTLEADGTSDTGILNDMLAINRLGYDLVLASVYAQGGGFEKTSLLRKIISFGANQLFRFFFDMKVLTLSSFYRVYSVSLIRKIKAQNRGIIIEEAEFISMLEILLKAIRCRAKIIEVPMMLRSSKRSGKSKMKLIRTGFSYLNFLIRNQKL